MRDSSCAPGLTYYLVGAIALSAVVCAAAVALGAWQPDTEIRERLFFGGVAAAVILCVLLLGWHRFTLRPDGLHVADVRGSRLHRWEDLGKPRTKTFSDKYEDSILLDLDRQRGIAEPQVYSHHICNARGKTLYRLGPWYPRRRDLMREIRRRLREER